MLYNTFIAHNGLFSEYKIKEGLAVFDGLETVIDQKVGNCIMLSRGYIVPITLTALKLFTLNSFEAGSIERRLSVKTPFSVSISYLT